MLNPGTANLSCYVGGTWSIELDFWDDQAQTAAHNFTGWTVTMSIFLPGAATVTPAIVVTGNAVVLGLTSTQTALFTPGTGRHVLEMFNTASPPDVEYLLHGSFTVTSP